MLQKQKKVQKFLMSNKKFRKALSDDRSPDSHQLHSWFRNLTTIWWKVKFRREMTVFLHCCSKWEMWYAVYSFAVFS